MKKFTNAAVILFATACLFSCSKDTPPPLPVAGFNYLVEPTSATPTFTNTSTSATSYSWNFGDGTYSSLQNPLHTYASVGTYTVTLTATNSSGSSTSTATFNIGANSANISHIQITNINNAAVLHQYVYMVFKYTDGTEIIGSSFYIANSSVTSLGWNINSHPITNITSNNQIYVFEQTGASQNPSGDIQLLGTNLNFTNADNTGFLNNGIYPTTVIFNSLSGYYNQIFTVNWQ